MYRLSSIIHHEKNRAAWYEPRKKSMIKDSLDLYWNSAKRKFNTSVKSRRKDNKFEFNDAKLVNL